MHVHMCTHAHLQRQRQTSERQRQRQREAEIDRHSLAEDLIREEQLQRPLDRKLQPDDLPQIGCREMEREKQTDREKQTNRETDKERQTERNRQTLTCRRSHQRRAAAAATGPQTAAR
jgi:hypothetical protein